jgi:uncharacterized protein YkwD
MSQSHLMVPKHLARSLACALLVAGSLVATTAPASAAADCPNSELTPTASNAGIIRAATMCLINAERAQLELRPVHGSPKLRRAARRHSADMVRAGYFAHTAPDGDTFVDRVLATGYVREDDAWSLGENLAWGTGERSTPRDIHAAWMRSRGHKANILKRSFRDIGIGIHLGIPTDAGVGVTVTTKFGVKA